MSRCWILSLAALGFTAAPVRAQTLAETFFLTQRSALIRDSLASERERLRRLLGLPPTAPRGTFVTVDTVRAAARCPMPVAVPHTSTLARLPVDRRDSSRLVPMPTARRSCFNALFRP
jgi:hypothetical protein